MAVEVNKLRADITDTRNSIDQMILNANQDIDGKGPALDTAQTTLGNDFIPIEAQCIDVINTLYEWYEATSIPELGALLTAAEDTKTNTCDAGKAAIEGVIQDARTDLQTAEGNIATILSILSQVDGIIAGYETITDIPTLQSYLEQITPLHNQAEGIKGDIDTLVTGIENIITNVPRMTVEIPRKASSFKPPAAIAKVPPIIGMAVFFAEFSISLSPELALT